jgi:hypothetical protein
MAHSRTIIRHCFGVLYDLAKKATHLADCWKNARGVHLTSWHPQAVQGGVSEAGHRESASLRSSQAEERRRLAEVLRDTRPVPQAAGEPDPRLRVSLRRIVTAYGQSVVKPAFSKRPIGTVRSHRAVPRCALLATVHAHIETR